MIRLLFLVMLVLLPVKVIGQPVFVQTGEHPTFTRVVVDLPDPDTWRFGRVMGGYALRLPVSDGYDLQRFFDIIPRQRITAVTQDVARGELRLEVDCACRADVVLLPDGYLVIDILDGLPMPNSAFEVSLDAPMTGDVFAGNSILPVIFDVPDLPVPVDIGPATMVQMAAPEPPADVSFSDDLAALETLVIENLGRGLTEGFLTAERPTAATAPIPPPTLTAPLPGIAVRTGLDPAAILTEPIAVDDQGLACAPDDLLDVARWADASPFVDQFAMKRAALIRDFDMFDPLAVTDLARFYVHFGFGREAVQTLALDAGASQERQYLRLIAAVLDEDAVSFVGLTEQVTCPSRIALWAMLALPEAAINQSANRAAVLRSYKELPLHLQIHLGPRLAKRFAAIGDDDAAAQVLGAAEAIAPARIETRLAQSTLASQRGDHENALTILADITETNQRITADTMVLFLDEAVRQGRAISAADMLTADALRFENALTPVAAELAIAQVRAYLAAASFDDAARVIADETDNLAQDQRRAVADAFAIAAVADMPDAEFLAYAMTVDLITANPAAQIADRLSDIGFPDAARDLLVRTGYDDFAGPVRYAKARALLDLGEIATALTLLQADDTPQAERLRETAANLQAGRAPVTSGNPLNDNWRNGDWRELTQTDDALLRDTATSLLAPPPAFDTQIPLTSGRQILQQAEQSRQIVDALFQRFTSPADF
jgi:hypothetical protein